ncbi:MAG: FG-GAP-like repeat-containing protein, partial [bacterium]
MDVLSVSKSDNTVSWYENDGAADPTFTQHVITNTGWPGSQSPVSVYAADVDGDGDMDVLTAAYDHKIQWYENNGDEDFTPHVITTEARYASSVYAADIDGDGDMDVLSASNEDDKITWYENDGVADPTFTTHIITRDGNGPSSVYAADIDGDGEMDVLSASNNDDKITWHRNDGAADPTFTTHIITTGADDARGVYAADMDGDGDLDVLSASYADDKIAWYENLGASAAGFWPTSLPSSQRVGHVITTGANGASGVYAADIDGDGNLDVLSASNLDDKIAWYENVQAIDMGAVERKHIDPPALSRSVTLQPGDSVTNLHFGIAAMPGRIHGVQYFDRNGDGVRNTAWASEERGTQGWQVFLDTNANDSYDVGEPTTTTDLLGYYEFDNLAPMQTYSVGAILPEGYEQTSPETKP